LFDRAGTSANTLSEDVLVEFETVLAALEQDRPAGSSFARQNLLALSPARTSTSFAARAIRARSKPGWRALMPWSTGWKVSRFRPSQ
jgi:hypothetical protein